MLYEKILHLQEGDNDELLPLIDFFRPLLNKYAFLLGYQDAYNDLQLSLIEVLHNMQLKTLHTKDDGAVVEYIRVTVTNLYKNKVKKVIKRKQEIPMSALSENQRLIMEANNSYCDDTFIFEYELGRILSSEEAEILNLIYVMEFSSSDVARMQCKSRQAINQKKIRALNKLRVSMKNGMFL